MERASKAKGPWVFLPYQQHQNRGRQSDAPSMKAAGTSRAGLSRSKVALARHAPLTQLCPGRHVVPQPPQLRGSLVTEMQSPGRPLQFALPGLQLPLGLTHAPLTQLWPDRHFVPQLPQLLGSFPADTHVPPHLSCPAPQTGPPTLGGTTPP